MINFFSFNLTKVLSPSCKAASCIFLKKYNQVCEIREIKRVKNKKILFKYRISIYIYFTVTLVYN